MKTITAVFTVLVFLNFLEKIYGFKLTIVHTNDFHSRFEEMDVNGRMCFQRDREAGLCYGGVARRATEIKRIRSQEKNVVLLDAGDVFTGTLWYVVYRGNATWKFMNELGYDAMTLGNHDFDDGPANTARFLSNINCSVVISNLDASKEPTWSRDPPLFVKSKVLVIGGEKVGIVGYTLQSISSVSHPGPNLRFLPEIESVRSAVSDLKRQGINKIIALGHAGILVDKKIAEQVDGVDVVVGGHSHTFLYSGNPIKEHSPKGPYPVVVDSSSNPGQQVPVVQDYAFGLYLGRLEVEFNSEGKVTNWSGQPILLDNNVTMDANMLREINIMKKKVDEISEMKLGRTLVYLNGNPKECGIKECNLGNIITDAMVFYYANQTANSNQWTEVSVAFQMSGSIVVSIDTSPQEYITFGHVYNSLPYNNTYDLIELKGTDLKAVLEYSVSTYDPLNPQAIFLQVSGLHVQYDVSKPSGQRVVSVKVRCSACREPVYHPLRDNTIYKVVAPSYIVKGGAGYTVLKEKTLSRVVGSHESDILAFYLKANDPVATGVEGRITFVGRESIRSIECVACIESFLVIAMVVIANTIPLLAQMS
ncbi:snake venom 5'-nucleotidase-like [Actinia tenebrosa]|uniref:5'-nucleotidase n=1 Tax=Actinia tenebrosa TaxID=6105 RepID=A0A6P8IVD4_ACTTE|nr:snake venom 5'-nucleotidase-like [Actinia tenebrosa]